MAWGDEYSSVPRDGEKRTVLGTGGNYLSPQNLLQNCVHDQLWMSRVFLASSIISIIRYKSPKTFDHWLFAPQLDVVIPLNTPAKTCTHITHNRLGVSVHNAVAVVMQLPNDDVHNMTRWIGSRYEILIESVP